MWIGSTVTSQTKRMPHKNSPSNVPGDLGKTITQEHILVLKKIGEGLKDDAN